MLLVEIIKKLTAKIPVLKGHYLGIELILIQLYNRARVVEYSIIVGPVAHSF